MSKMNQVQGLEIEWLVSFELHLASIDNQSLILTFNKTAHVVL